MKYVGENALKKLMNLIKGKLDTKVNKSGDTITGAIRVQSTVTIANAATGGCTLQYDGDSLKFTFN